MRHICCDRDLCILAHILHLGRMEELESECYVSEVGQGFSAFEVQLKASVGYL